jgi:hypothetical protein
MKDIIENTKHGSLDYRKGPHWWNRTGKTPKHGTVIIRD